MSYVFSIFMVFVAMIGGGYLFKLSDDNYEGASVGYAFVGILWAGACLYMACNGLGSL